MIVLDTDIFTLLYFRHPTLTARAERHREEHADDPITLSVVTWIEVLRGRSDSILKAADEAELLIAVDRFEQSRAFLNEFGFVSINAAAATHFEHLRKRKKLKMRRTDLLIACTALAHDALLVTRNLKDYRNVPDLSVENWVD